MNRFSASETIIAEIMAEMKRHHNIHPAAIFDPTADGNLRKQVCYRDEDFLWFLGRTKREEEIAENLRVHLINSGVVSPAANYDTDAFNAYRSLVRKNFSGSWTSFTPVMERVMYMLTALKKPQRVVEIGCFWGNTLAWFAGPALGDLRLYDAAEIIGIDRDVEMMKKAKKNFSSIGHTDSLRLLTGSGEELIAEIADPIDYLYLEAKSDEEPELYLQHLKLVYDRLPKGAWVIAHDIYDKDTIDEIQPYLDSVRDPTHFSFSIAIDVDFCGLELSVK